MAITNMKAIFCNQIDSVWNLVTSLDNYAWRSDLEKIEVLADNENMHGQWVGLFSYEDGKTTIDFTEQVTVKKIIMKPFAGMYLKRQQAKYVEDLKKALVQKQGEIA